MARLFITQFARQGRDDRGGQPVGEEPNLGTIVVDTGTNGGVSAKLNRATKLLRLHAVDAAVAFHTGIGATAPEPGTAPVIPAGAVEYFGIDDAVVRGGAAVIAVSAA